MNVPATLRLGSIRSGWRRVVALLVIVGCGAPLPRTDPPASAPAVVSPLSGPMDAFPGRRTASPGGAWEALVYEGGALGIRRPGAEPVRSLDVTVDPRLAFSADERVLYYARQGALAETDLWRVVLPSGAPELITDWVGSEDRPTPSPDGRRLAFVSGHTGIASWWVVAVDGPVPVPLAAARQITNVGLGAHRPGVAPEGFVPVPDGATYRWTAAGLEWVAGGHAYSVVVPP